MTGALPTVKSGPGMLTLVVGVALVSLLTGWRQAPVPGQGAGPAQVPIPGASCDHVADGAIVESPDFTPYEGRLSHMKAVALNPRGDSAPSAASLDGFSSRQLDGLDIKLERSAADGSIAQYLLDRPIERDMTPEGFLAAGGILFERWPHDPSDSLAAYMLAEFPTRTVAVDIGPYPGALNWGDPISNGLRPHALTWSDGTNNFRLNADRSAVEIVNLARDLVCAG